MLSFFFSFIHVAEKQEGSVPAWQSESSIASVKYSGGLHNADVIGDCSMKTHISSGLLLE